MRIDDSARRPRICVVIADHRHDQYLTDLVRSLRVFAPTVDVAVYNAGDAERLIAHPVYEDIRVLPMSRRLLYAKVTPFFLDLFEWAGLEEYDYVVNAETDMAWIKPGFEDFIAEAMRGYDYMGPGFLRGTARTSKWRPYRSLRPELPELHALLGVAGTNRCFSPAQVFSAKYINALLSSPFYDDLKRFVIRNQAPDKSFTLQEVLLPTLVDALSLTGRDYPGHLATVNRYRPYHAARSVVHAVGVPDAYFVHPIRRDEQDPARIAARQIIAGASAVGVGQ
ncbi:hypothetical protein AB0M46_23265 [Dactylosporangium sp. NPDC051485]|uniref:hypothetical protein n=1 Tax=Dactylosporangium sp. NPDC051485 TaxID=3154846 RepID=UPI003446B211